MRDYGKVFTGFWTSQTTACLTDGAKVLAIYLLSSPHTNMIGCFRLPDAYVSEDLQRSIETVGQGFAELLQQGFASRDPATRWVFVHKFLEWNEIENPNQGIAAIKLFHQVPDSFGGKRALAESLFRSISRFAEKIRPEVWNHFVTVTETLSPTVSKPGTGTGTGTGTGAGTGTGTGMGGECDAKNKKPAAAARPAPDKAVMDEVLTAFKKACRETWLAYTTAYRLRYGIDPVSNAKTNKQVNDIVKRIGAEDGPLLAAWFLSHPNSYYVGRGHDIGALQSDCEKLRTEWATGRVMTAGKARQEDRKGTNADAVREVMARMEAKS